MSRRSTRGPDWFDLANYDSLRTATLGDWLVELRNRKLWFSILSRARTDERYSGHGGKAHASAVEGWKQIRRFGSLTGAQRRSMTQLQERFTGGPQTHQLLADLNSIEAVQRADREKWLAEHGESSEQGSSVTRLTKGDVLMRFLIAEELEDLAQEVNDTDTFPHGVLSPVPMDTIGATTGEDVGFLRVDLHAPDQMIRAEFDAWLTSRRRVQASCGTVTPRVVGNTDFSDWCNFQILPYLDLDFAVAHEGFRLSQEQIGTLLFPDEIDVSLAERVRKVTRPKAVAVFSDSFLRGMERQHRTPPLGERNE